MSEVIAVRCHKCRVGMKVKPEYAGKLRKCPKCGVIFEVPFQDGETKAPSPEMLAKLKAQEARKQASESVSHSTPTDRTPSATSSAESSTTSTTTAGTPTISFGFPGSASISNPLGSVFNSADSVPNPENESDQSLNSENRIHPVEHPKRLVPGFRYLILDSERLLAVWQLETGWQVNDGSRLVSAKRNAQILPKQGDFRFIELQLGSVNDEFLVTKLRIFQLARQYSVSKIAQDENEVLSTISGASSLTRSQKNALFQGLKKYFMRSVWADSPAVYDFLLNEDFHSSEIG